MPGHPQDGASFFSPDDVTAHDRFREEARGVGAAVEALPIEAKGPGGRNLAIEAAWWGDTSPERLLIVSSGLHGVEGFFGSAVQLAALADRFGGWEPGKGEAILLLHGLNPFGFAWRRRFDEANVDLNRNFLRDGEPYSGAPPRYGDLSPLLNPRRGAGRLDAAWFRARAMATILRWGLPAVKQTVAGGQYEWPEGLFFGGKEPSAIFRLLVDRLPVWVGDARVVRHLDFHTGLGAWGTYKLLASPAASPARVDVLRGVFGASALDNAAAAGVAYDIRGGLGTWIEWRFSDRDCVSLTPEFGAYGPITVLAALRDENRARLFKAEDDPARRRAKARMVEVYAPASKSWRDQTVARGVELLRVARRWTFARA